MKAEVLDIVSKLPPPGKLRKPGSEPADEGDDYSAAEDSMAAFIAAVKSGDAATALDAFGDVKKNC